MRKRSFSRHALNEHLPTSLAEIPNDPLDVLERIAQNEITRHLQVVFLPVVFPLRKLVAQV